MKNIFQYIFIGFIQGITEFLPISSSGHIVLFGSFFELDNLLLVSVVAHFGTLFAVIYCYKTKLWQLIRHPINKTNLNLIFASIPTAIIFLVFHNFLENSFSTKTLIWGFLISAILLLIADLKKEGKNSLNKKNAFCMGLSQGLALLPGISRSGSTLVCGLLVGVEKEQALDFSFLMSIPIILASGVFESLKIFHAQLTLSWIAIFLVMFSSFIFGIISIKIMLKLIKNNKLYFFSIYLVLLSLFVLLFL